MKKYLFKGLAICTFFCTMIALPSRADICFLPSGICDVDARPAESEGGALTCDDYKNAGHYYTKSNLPANRTCTKVNIPLENCELYDCPSGDCRAQGYELGPTYSEETWPLGRQDTEAWSCTPCQQGSQYWWKCIPLPCDTGLVIESAGCADGMHWEKVDGAHKSGSSYCGKCMPNVCPTGENIYETIPSGCYICPEVRYLDESQTKACYYCHVMAADFITATEKESLGEGCYKYDVTAKAADGQICYRKDKVTCATDEYFKTIELGNGRKKCSCEDCTYAFTADKEMHFTAAGGTLTNNVVSTRECDKVNDWAYENPDKTGTCTISKTDSGKLNVTCPANKTTSKKETTFTIRQVEFDGVTDHTLTIKVIIDPDTCVNPDAVDSCGQAGKAKYTSGPRPACYDIGLSSQISCDTGYSKLASASKSIAGQACYYCIKNTCPTQGYTLGETPAPAEGYVTEKTDVGNNCYKIKDCPANYSTAYQSVNDCGNKQHPQGWNFSSNGMSGNKVCGKCDPKTCSGAGFDYKCESSKRCTNESDSNCGYKDLNKTNPASTEWEGDTPKYNCNKKPCPTGSSTNQTDGCGTNNPVGKSGEDICWEYTEPDRTCPTDYKYDDNQCQCVCNKTCGEDYTLDTTSCTCTENCKRGDGYFGSDCCEDSDCLNSSEFPLYCFKGKCYECETVADCSFKNAPRDRYFTKYRSSRFSTTYPLSTCNNGANSNCYPKYTKNTVPPAFEKYKVEPTALDERKQCDAGECKVGSCKVTGSGEIGDGCCKDTDCKATSEFPLYCFDIASENGQSVKSCRECGKVGDCDTFDTSMTRFHKKYGSSVNSFKDSKNRTVSISQKDGHNVFSVVKNAGESASTYGYVPTHNFACRLGECLTWAPCPSGFCEANGGCYDAQYFYEDGKCDTPRMANGTYIASSPTKGQDDTCPAGQTKDYDSCEDGYVHVGKTEFGSFCYRCKDI